MIADAGRLVGRTMSEMTSNPSESTLSFSPGETLSAEQVASFSLSADKLADALRSGNAPVATASPGPQSQPAAEPPHGPQPSPAAEPAAARTVVIPPKSGMTGRADPSDTIPTAPAHGHDARRGGGRRN